MIKHANDKNCRWEDMKWKVRIKLEIEKYLEEYHTFSKNDKYAIWITNFPDLNRIQNVTYLILCNNKSRQMIIERSQSKKMNIKIVLNGSRLKKEA